MLEDTCEDKLLHTGMLFTVFISKVWIEAVMGQPGL